MVPLCSNLEHCWWPNGFSSVYTQKKPKEIKFDFFFFLNFSGLNQTKQVEILSSQNSRPIFNLIIIRKIFILLGITF